MNNSVTEEASFLRDRVKQYWVEDVLHQQPIQNLTLNLYSEQQQCFINSYNLLPTTGNLITLLGGTGMGKTILLTQLVASSSSLVPLLLDLTKWSPQENEAFADWIIKQAHYFYQISQLKLREKLDTEPFLLLLDNFDELTTQKRTNCAKSLEELQKKYPQWGIIVATRPPLCSTLPATDTIVIKCFTKEQIRAYFNNLSQGQQLQIIWQSDSRLQTLARIPLFLSLLILTYDDLNVKKQLSLSQIRDHLFATYIKRQLNLTLLHPYSSQQLQKGLSWLARKLEENGQTVFLMDYMRQNSEQNWLDGRLHHQLYLLCVWGIGSLMTTPIIGLSSGVLGGLLLGWFRGPIGGFFLRQLHRPFGGAIASWFRRPVEKVAIAQIRPPLIWLSRRFAIPFLRQPLWRSLLHYGPRMLLGNLLKKSPYLASTLASLGLVATIKSQRPHPNQRIWEATRTTLWWGIGGASIATLILTPFGASFWHAKIAGLLLGLFAGGITSIEHFVLRTFLTLTKKTPWNYSHFLDKAVSCGFLYRVGRGYSFVHRDLQSYFARQS